MIEANKAMVFDLVMQIAKQSCNNDLTDEQVVEQINRLAHSDALTTSDLTVLEEAADIMQQLFGDLCAYNNN
jgi:hypothetical protein